TYILHEYENNGIDLQADWTQFDEAKFNQYRTSREAVTRYHQFQNTPVATSNPVITQPSPVQQGPDPAARTIQDWKRGVKRDPTVFSDLSSDSLWESWNRSFTSTIGIQMLGHVLKHSHTPESGTTEAAIFSNEQGYVYNVLNRVVQTNRGREIVRRYYPTRDARKAYTDLCAHYQHSMGTPPTANVREPPIDGEDIKQGIESKHDALQCVTTFTNEQSPNLPQDNGEKFREKIIEIVSDPAANPTRDKTYPDTLTHQGHDGIFHDYAYLVKGCILRSSPQPDHFGQDVSDKTAKVGALPYIAMRLPSGKELDQLPHEIMTLPAPWHPPNLHLEIDKKGYPTFKEASIRPGRNKPYNADLPKHPLEPDKPTSAYMMKPIGSNTLWHTAMSGEPLLQGTLFDKGRPPRQIHLIPLANTSTHRGVTRNIQLPKSIGFQEYYELLSAAAVWYDDSITQKSRRMIYPHENDHDWEDNHWKTEDPFDIDSNAHMSRQRSQRGQHMGSPPIRGNQKALMPKEMWHARSDSSKAASDTLSEEEEEMILEKGQPNVNRSPSEDVEEEFRDAPAASPVQTAKCNVQFQVHNACITSKSFAYTLSSKSAKSKQFIVDKAYGGILGQDCKVICVSNRTMDIQNTGNHQLDYILIGTVARCIAMGREHPIHSPGQLKLFKHAVCDKSHVGGTQRIKTTDGYIIHMATVRGLPRIRMKSPKNIKFCTFPHIVLTHNNTWESTILDFDHTEEDDQWFDDIEDIKNTLQITTHEMYFDSSAVDCVHTLSQVFATMNAAVTDAYLRPAITHPITSVEDNVPRWGVPTRLVSDSAPIHYSGRAKTMPLNTLLNVIVGTGVLLRYTNKVWYRSLLCPATDDALIPGLDAFGGEAPPYVRPTIFSKSSDPPDDGTNRTDHIPEGTQNIKGSVINDRGDTLVQLSDLLGTAVADVNHDGCNNTLLVANDHLTDAPFESVHSVFSSKRGLRIVKSLGKLNDPAFGLTDIRKTHLGSCTWEDAYTIGCDSFHDKDRFIFKSPNKYIPRMHDTSVRFFVTKSRVDVYKPLEKGNHHELDTLGYVETDDVLIYRYLIRTMQWVILLVSYLMRFKDACIRFGSNKPDYTDLPERHSDPAAILSKHWRYSDIWSTLQQFFSGTGRPRKHLHIIPLINMPIHRGVTENIKSFLGSYEGCYDGTNRTDHIPEGTQNIKGSVINDRGDTLVQLSDLLGTAVADVNHDGCNNTLLVANDHLTDAPFESVHSVFSSKRGLRIVKSLGKLNDPAFGLTDIRKTHLGSCTWEDAYTIGCDSFHDKDRFIFKSPNKYIPRMHDTSVRFFVTKSRVDVYKPLEKGNHHELDTLGYVETDDVLIYRYLIRTMQWVILLVSYLMRFKDACIRFGSNKPDYTDLPERHSDPAAILSKHWRYSDIWSTLQQFFSGTGRPRKHLHIIPLINMPIHRGVTDSVAMGNRQLSREKSDHRHHVGDGTGLRY
ncbi:hypothetical protein IV203_023718, partial [Nitzschia inconspicua]